MANEETPTPETTNPEPEPQVEDGKDRDWKALREKAERAEQLEQQLRDQVFQQVPFDRTDTGDLTGIGKAVAKEYSGDLTVEAITEYAQAEYGWAPPAPKTTAQTMAEDLRQVGAVAASSEPVVAPRNYREAVEQRERDHPAPVGEVDRELLRMKADWAAEQALERADLGLT